MKRSLAAAAALALGAGLGMGSTATYALWQDQSVISATITSGYVHFAVDDPKSTPQELNRIAAAGETITWDLPEEVLANVAPGKPQTAVVQIDAQSQGSRGLAYSLDGVRVSGDASLAAVAEVNIRTVQNPSQCKPSAERTPGLYDGPLTGAYVDAQHLVTTAYTDAPWTTPVTQYLCLTASVPNWRGSDTSTATVKGTAAGGLGQETEVRAKDSWSGNGVPSEAARHADVEFTFSYQTYRAGGLQ